MYMHASMPYLAGVKWVQLCARSPRTPFPFLLVLEEGECSEFFQSERLHIITNTNHHCCHTCSVLYRCVIDFTTTTLLMSHSCIVIHDLLQVFIL